MNGFKKCPNGHYYKEELASCPYCPGSQAAADNGDPYRTNILNGGYAMDGGGFADSGAKTEVYGGFDGAGYGEPVSGDNPTQIIDGDVYGRTVAPGMNMPESPKANHTVFGDEIIEQLSDGSHRVVMQERSARMLVGWLVTYSFDSMGVDYKLYEGRNTIGRDPECNITVDDGLISGKHAMILFRDNKYRIRDEMSSHGTFVNGVDIEDEPHVLHDGDTIKIGKTVFKFRSSL